MEKKSPKGERAVKPVISLPSEKWVLKIIFQKLKISPECQEKQRKRKEKIKNGHRNY